MTFCFHVIMYQGDLLINQPDLFLTDRHSQDFNSVFGNHIKTYVQNLNKIGSLVDNISCL